MIEKCKIAQAARMYAESVSEARGYDHSKAEYIAYIEGIATGFEEGAHWAIQEFLKELWHDASEEPNKKISDILTLCSFDNYAYLQFEDSILWREESWRHSISRCAINKWAYLSDILPKQKGGE